MPELFTVASECRQLGLRAGAILFRGVQIGPASAQLRAAIEAEVANVRSRFADAATARALPELQAFQAVLRRVGVNPRREQPSVERLLNHALKRGTLPAVNSLVDAYNLVSVRTLCSLGAHDLDLMQPPVALRLFTSREEFTPLGSRVAEPVQGGQFGYVDAAGRVLCRLDVRQAEFSKVTEKTRNAILIVEGTASHSETALERAVQEAVAEITHACGGSAEMVARP